MHDPLKDKQPVKVKRNAEKRKAKSRDAARSRRGKEADVFSELSSFIPVPAETVAGMDKASVMRLAISHLKLRTLMGGFDDSSDLNAETNLDHQYEQALGGFLVVMDKEGEFVYVSDNVVKHIGLAQLDLLGQTIQEYSHPCDHEEIEEFLSEKHSTTDDDDEEEEVPPIKTFFVRLKSTLTNKGRNVNLKSATYKVIRFRGHRIVNKGLDCWLLIGESIPHPSQADLPIENSALITRHSLDTKFTYCDERMEEVLGYTSEELENKSLFEFHHAQDGNYMDKIYRDLFSKGQVWTDHYRFLVKHGGFKWIETQATVIHNPKTDKPQYIICIHSVLSGIEEEGKILSTVQEAAKVASPLKKKVTMAEPVKMPKGPILSTESIFVPRTKEMDSGICAPKQKLKEEMETEMGQIAPTAGNEITPLSFDGQDSDMVSLLQDVLLQASEIDNRKLSQFHLSLDEDEANQALKETPYETPNLEQLVDQLPGSSSHFARQTKLVDADDIDLDMRAPFIPMSGEDAVLFQMAQPVPLMDDCENGPMHMLGTTESVFNARPEDPNEVNKKIPIPISILRQEAMQKQEKQYKEMEHKKVTMKMRHPTETNRLETGPPAKKLCLAVDIEPDLAYSLLSEESTHSPQLDNIKGSSVLKNLLLTGHDDSNGYDIMKCNSQLQKPSVLQTNSTLRGLLTGPMSYTPPTTPSTISSSVSSSPSHTSPTSPLSLGSGSPIQRDRKPGGKRMFAEVAELQSPNSGDVDLAAALNGESSVALSDEMLMLLYNLCQGKVTVE